MKTINKYTKQRQRKQDCGRLQFSKVWLKTIDDLQDERVNYLESIEMSFWRKNPFSSSILQMFPFRDRKQWPNIAVGLVWRQQVCWLNRRRLEKAKDRKYFNEKICWKHFAAFTALKSL